MNIQSDGSLHLTKEDAEALASYFKKTIFLEPINEQTENIQKFFRTLNVIDGDLAGPPNKPYNHAAYLRAQAIRLNYQREILELDQVMKEKITLFKEFEIDKSMNDYNKTTSNITLLYDSPKEKTVRNLFGIFK